MRPIVFGGRLLLLVVVLQSVSACSWLDRVFPDRSKDYKTAEPASSLEVPPDLMSTTVTDALVVSDGSTTLSGYTSARETLARGGSIPVLPEQAGIALQRERDQAWLVIQGDPTAVWERSRDFWVENGFLIAREDPATAVLETNWAENRASIPKGPIRSVIGRVFENAYSSAYRDRYRMRLEYGEQAGTTELFISHQGIEEIVSNPEDVGATKWGPRPPDPGLESEMLKRMMIYLGVEPAAVDRMIAEKEPRQERAELIQQDSGEATLVVHEGFARAWRSVGIALGRVDFAVDDRDRSIGIYYVRYNDPLKGQNKGGFFSKLAFWSDDDEQVERFQVKLTDDGVDTRVVVLNAEGESEASVTAVRILTLLHEELQ